jgi:steroid delta-isomerase-like uncharacterized protein
MSTETNKAIIVRMLEQLFNEGRIDLVEEFFAEDYVEVIAGQPPATGYERLREAIGMVRNAFADFHLSIDEMVAEGDRVAIRWTTTGTHHGELLGIPASGKQIEHSGATFYRLANGRLVEIWFLADMLVLRQQIGVVPAPEAA